MAACMIAMCIGCWPRDCYTDVDRKLYRKEKANLGLYAGGRKDAYKPPWIPAYITMKTTIREASF